METQKQTGMEQKVTAQISHLIKILVDHLQTDPFAPVREYISNSHDATVNVKNPKIQIWGEGSKLFIRDNGCGMTKEVISNAYTRIAGHFRQAEDLDTIGMFGIGVLSAFIAAEKLEVITRSPKEKNGWRLIWERYQESFFLEPYDKEEQGTVAILHLDFDYYDLANNYELEGYINRTFALFDTPIYGADSGGKPINHLCRWFSDLEESGEKTKLLKGAEIRELVSKFSHHELIAAYYAVEEDGTRIFLGIPNTESSPIVDKDAINFFSKGIFVHGNIRAFFPQNLSFVVGMVDSPSFKLQISREEIFIQDPQFEKVRRSMESHILAFLELIAEENTSLVEDVLHIHRAKLVAHGKENTRLCELFKDYYCFETSKGCYRWREMLPHASGQGHNKVIFVTSSEIEIWEGVNSNNNGLLTVFALGAERIILDHIAKSDAIRLKDAAEIESNGEVDDVPEPFRQLASMLSRHLGRKNIRTVVFVNLPGSGHFPTTFRIRTSQGNTMLPQGGNNIPQHSYSIDALMLNIAHPLIRRLAGKRSLSRKMYENIAEALYQIAVLNSPFNDLWASSKEDIIENLMQSIEVRVGLKKKPEDFEPGAADCFVALPYKEEFHLVWETINQVLAAPPYNWKVIRADRNIRDNNLLSNVQSLIKSSHRFLADISGLNSNVLIEVGLMLENDPEGLLIICDEETYRDLPTDLKGKLILVYPSSLRDDTGPFSQQFAEKIKAYSEWIAMAG